MVSAAILAKSLAVATRAKSSDCLEKEWRCVVPSPCPEDCPPTPVQPTEAPPPVVTDDEGTYEAVVLAGSIAIDIVESTLPATGSVQTAGTNPTTIDVPADGTATDLDGYNFVSALPSDSPSESPSATPALCESK
jgi:hypothetical protein